MLPSLMLVVTTCTTGTIATAFAHDERTTRKPHGKHDSSTTRTLADGRESYGETLLGWDDPSNESGYAGVESSTPRPRTTLR